MKQWSESEWEEKREEGESKMYHQHTDEVMNNSSTKIFQLAKQW